MPMHSSLLIWIGFRRANDFPSILYLEFSASIIPAHNYCKKYMQMKECVCMNIKSLIQNDEEKNLCSF